MAPVDDNNTCVFWDVEDYPIPSGLDPLSMKERMESVLAALDFPGVVSFHAYFDKNTSSDEKRRQFLNTGIKIDFLPQGEGFARTSSMLVDIYLWALVHNTGSNVVVLSKNFDQEANDRIGGLYLRRTSIFLSDYESRYEARYLPLSECSAWFLTYLFDGDNTSGYSLLVCAGETSCSKFQG